MRILTGILIVIWTLLAPNSQQQGLPPIDYIAFKPGEYLKYDLHFGAIHAGEAVLEVKPDLKAIGGKEHFHIYISGKSYSVFDPFYKVRDYYESFVDTKTIFPTVFIRNVQEGSYAKKEFYIFDRAKDQVTSDNKVFHVTDDVHDIVSAFYYLRCIDFSKIKVGTFVPINTFFDEANFPIGITYTGKTTINTEFGKVRCMTFKPKLIEGRVFKSQSDMTIFVTDDKNQLPIRIQSAVYLGYVRADLSSYKNIKFPFDAKVAEK